MEPLLGDMPLVGALSVFFLKKPVSTPTLSRLLYEASNQLKQQNSSATVKNAAQPDVCAWPRGELSHVFGGVLGE